MPKGIRKACANCIKARLACDEGRPCQRCVVHACECVAVPRKPRVKKQKLDMDPPPAIDKLNIPSIDSNSDVVVPNWGQVEFAQGAFGAFQLDRSVHSEETFDGFAPNLMLSPASTGSPSRLSPLFFDTTASFQQISSPMIQLASPISAQLPSPPPMMMTPPASPATVFIAQNRQIQAPLVQPSPLTSSGILPQQPSEQPIQSIPELQNLPQQSVQQSILMQQQFTQDIKSELRQGYDSAQMLSLLLEEKPSALLNDWQGAQVGTYVDGQQVQAMSYYDFKKPLTPIAALPQPMNATPLYPAPIAVFDKMKFQLLDSNEAMARFIGLNTVAEMATKVTCVDDLIDAEAAQVTKQAYINFVSNPSPCFRLGEIRTHDGSLPKSVEFHVDLTEQLLIFTIKSVFDNSSRALPDVIQYPHLPIKTDMSPAQQCKAFEFLSPID